MSAGLLDPKNVLSVYRGESKTLLLLVDQPDPDNVGAYLPVDLTGASVYFTVKTQADSIDIVLQKTTAQITEIELSDPRGGLARIFLHPLDTQPLSTRATYVFDVWVVLGSGARHPVVPPSTFRVLPAVTHLV